MSGPVRIEPGDRRGLRRFAVTMAIAFPLLFWLVLPWLFGFSRPLWPWLVSGVMLLGTLWPPAIYPVYRGWMAVAGVLGAVNSRLVLGLAFFGMLAPMGWVLRRLGKLQYREGFDKSRASYRVPAHRVMRREDLENPF